MINKKAQGLGNLAKPQFLILIVIGLLIYLVFFSKVPTIAQNPTIIRIRETIIQYVPAEFDEDEVPDPTPETPWTDDDTCTYICGDQMEEGGNPRYDYGYFDSRELCELETDLLMVFAMEDGVCCCGNYEEGGGGGSGGSAGDGVTPYTYDECGATALHPYYDLVLGGQIDCDDHAWNYCVNNMGMALGGIDWYAPNCCVWFCEEF